MIRARVNQNFAVLICPGVFVSVCAQYKIRYTVQVDVSRSGHGAAEVKCVAIAADLREQGSVDAGKDLGVARIAKACHFAQLGTDEYIGVPILVEIFSRRDRATKTRAAVSVPAVEQASVCPGIGKNGAAIADSVDLRAWCRDENVVETIAIEVSAGGKLGAEFVYVDGCGQSGDASSGARVKIDCARRAAVVSLCCDSDFGHAIASQVADCSDCLAELLGIILTMKFEQNRAVGARVKENRAGVPNAVWVIGGGTDEDVIETVAIEISGRSYAGSEFVELSLA
jgi:hypothetical protein